MGSIRMLSTGRCYLDTPGEPRRVVQVDHMPYADYLSAVTTGGIEQVT